MSCNMMHEVHNMDWTTILIKMFYFIVLQNITMFKIILFAAITLMVALFIHAEAASMVKEVEERAEISGQWKTLASLSSASMTFVY